MAPQTVCSWLFRLAVAIVAPTMGCYSYYALLDTGATGTSWALPVTLATPLALAGLVLLVVALDAAPRLRSLLGLAALGLVMPLIILTLLRA